jgi:hypothetical protein
MAWIDWPNSAATPFGPLLRTNGAFKKGRNQGTNPIMFFKRSYFLSYNKHAPCIKMKFMVPPSWEDAPLPGN